MFRSLKRYIFNYNILYNIIYFIFQHLSKKIKILLFPPEKKHVVHKVLQSVRAATET